MKPLTRQLGALCLASFAAWSMPLAAKPSVNHSAREIAAAPVEPVPEKGVLTLGAGRSLLLRSKVDIHRTAVIDPAVCQIMQTTPREVSLVGRAAGQTQVTFWFSDPAMNPVTYLVEVQAQ
jgi:pilus assembly protein CpaC